MPYEELLGSPLFIPPFFIIFRWDITVVFNEKSYRNIQNIVQHNSLLNRQLS